MRYRAHILVLGLLSTCVAPAVAEAQSPSGAGRWEVEVHGGASFERNATDGEGALPPAGQSFTTAVGVPSRRASTWYFGDGALLLNQINAAFVGSPATGRITPLDSVLQKAAGTRDIGGSVGFRIGLAITPRFGAEFTLDSMLGHARFTDEALAGIEATRASFIAAWNERSGLISTGGGVVFINPAVTSIATVDDDRGRQLFSTGALTINLATRGRVIPYATAGAGLVTNLGDLPRATLTGNYRFDSLGAMTGYFPVNETDTVAVRLVAAHEHPVALVFGGGARIHGSNRWGLRADVRAYVSRNTLDVVVDASPHVTTSLPPGLVASTVAPSIQFTNIGGGVDSTLSGPPLAGFTTFSSSGTAVHVSASLGYFVRF